MNEGSGERKVLEGLTVDGKVGLTPPDNISSPTLGLLPSFSFSIRNALWFYWTSTKHQKGLSHYILILLLIQQLNEIQKKRRKKGYGNQLLQDPK